MLAQAYSPQQSITSPKNRVLIIEDEALFARAVVKRLQKAGFECEHADNLATGRGMLKQLQPDMVLLDMRLPDGNGMDLIAECVAKQVAVIVMTAHGEVSDAVAAIKLGASDYLKKPIDLEELLLVVQKNQGTTALKASLDYSRQRDVHAVEKVELIGDSLAMQNARAQIARIASLAAVDGAQPTVLICGETGTGKDVAARLLHQSSANRHKPFVHVDCASLPAELIESELFGHEKGAFTSAIAARPGLIEAAEDGTLFLDEIGELPLSLQAKLLNVLERRMVRRVGSTKERPVRARIVAATNRDLSSMVEEGRFRSDLFYRLNVIMLAMPPLRERGLDMLQLAYHFMRLTEKRYALPMRGLSKGAEESILAYAWPGNVREMRHQISRAVLLCTQAQLRQEDMVLLPSNHFVRAFPPAANTSQISLIEAEKQMLLNTLETAENNVSKAARILGITRMTMRYRMDKYGIKL